MKLLLSLIFVLSIQNVYAIRKGVKTLHSKHPYLVELKIGIGTCSGVRISKNSILTAAHCFKQKPRSFTIKYIANGKIYAQKAYGKKVIYKGRELSEELAIIPFTPTKTEIEFTPLKIFAYTPGRLLPQTHLSIMGFGMNTKGQRAFRKGVIQFKKDYLNVNYSFPMMLNEPIKKLNQLPCPGDSGGPVFINQEEETKLLGIVSFISSDKQNIAAFDSQKQCQLANVAAYIPLNLHLEFLSRYLD